MIFDFFATFRLSHFELLYIYLTDHHAYSVEKIPGF